MSTHREKFGLLLAANLVLTIGVVAVAMTVFRPASKADSDAESQLAARIAELERRGDADRAEIRKLKENEVRLSAQVAEVAEIANRPVPLAGTPPQPAPAAASPGAEPEEKEPTPEERMARGLAEMMRGQMKRQRDRFLAELINPDEQSRARQERQIQGMVDQVASRLSLDERDRTEVERILVAVDSQRRDQLRQVIQSKPSVDDVEYAEVKKVLDDSFAEEDRMIAASLPREKAEQYTETAEPIRQMIYVFSEAAFPKKEDGNKEE